MEYELTTEENDSIIKYDYMNLTDTEKNMVFKFVKKTESLIAFGTDFQLIKKDLFVDNELSNLSFDLYALSEPIIDGNGPIFFNTEYGVLNLDNSWGKRFLYLKKEKEPKFAEKLIEVLSNKTH